ncbi:MAG: LysR family transcriptional regulator [Pelomonas sp.]|nr:LysR family transcriptional regulator [Roseateles sp.]
MDFRQLRYFVAVAEELHFGRAAARLHLSQPPLSQQIKGLETRLGVQLFARDRQGVSLTPAGQTYLRHVYDLLHRAEAGANAARRVGHAGCGELRIGYSSSALYDALLPDAIARYRRHQPAVRVHLVAGTTRAHARGIDARLLDLAYVRGPLPERGADAPPRQVRCIASEPLLAALPGCHELAARARLSLRDFDQAEYVAFPRRMGAALGELVDALFARTHTRPRVAVEVTEMAALLGLVGAGVGVSLVPQSVSGLGARGVVFRPLLEPEARVELLELAGTAPAPAAEQFAALL